MASQDGCHPGRGEAAWDFGLLQAITMEVVPPFHTPGTAIRLVVRFD